jgi:hypothetical protein
VGYSISIIEFHGREFYASIHRKSEIQALYRVFKNVNSSFTKMFPYSSFRCIRGSLGRRASAPREIGERRKVESTDRTFLLFPKATPKESNNILKPSLHLPTVRFADDAQRSRHPLTQGSFNLLMTQKLGEPLPIRERRNANSIISRPVTWVQKAYEWGCRVE